MIDLKTLKEVGKTKGLKNLGQMEKDYFQDILLLYISRSANTSFFFKGGTCLYKLYSLDRFSEDLDFDGTPDKRFGPMLVKFLRNYGYSSQASFQNGLGNTSSLRVLISGPLYSSKNESMCRIVFDFSSREKPFLKPSFATYYPLYNDVPAFPLWSLNPSEIMAEKIRALIYRKKARDLYDINFLLRKRISTTIELVNRKLQLYEIEFSSELLRKAVLAVKTSWVSELGVFVESLPDFDTVSNFVLDSLGKML